MTQTAKNFEKLHSASKLITLYALSWVGMFYLYPEAAGFLVPAHIVCWVIAIFFFGLRVNWYVALLAGLAVCGLLLPVFQSNLVFLIRQGRGSISGYSWWTYFQAYFFGRDGVNSDFFANASDFAAGALGIYFTTPDSGTNPAVAAVMRTFILFGAVVLVFTLAKGARSLLSPNWLLLASHVGVSLLCTLGFCVLKQYWSAGKALSYFAYLLLLLLIASAFRTPLSDRSWLNRIGLTTVAVFLLLQFGFFFYRPVASSKPFGIPYAPPYPSVQDPKLKTMINFADWSFLHHLQSGDKVAVHIEDPFIQIFVRMLLLSYNVKFCLEPPAFYGPSVSTIVPTGNCPNPTVRLLAANSTKGPYASHLTLVRPENTPQP